MSVTKMIGHLRGEGRGYQMEAKAGGTAEIYLYDEISEWGISARQFAADLKELGPVTLIVLRINSIGGQIMHGLAIFNLLKGHPARVEVHVDGVAASMASAIAMSGDEIVIAENAFMVIHNPIGGEYGEADDLRAMADVLDKLKVAVTNTYVARTGLDAEKVNALMAEETWLDAQQAVELGFADRIDKALKVAARIDPSRLRGFASVPDSLQQHVQPMETRKMSASYQELKAALPEADAAFLCAQLDAGAEVDTAKAAFQKHQVDAARAEATEAKAAAAKAIADAKAQVDAAQAEAKAATDKAAALAKAPGVDPVADGKQPPTAKGEGYEGFWALVAEKEKAGVPRAKAISAVCRQDPELHTAMLDEHNAKHGRKNRARD